MTDQPQEAVRSAGGGNPELFGISVAHVEIGSQGGYRRVVFRFDGRDCETLISPRNVTRREVADEFISAYTHARKHFSLDDLLYIPAAEAFSLCGPVFKAFGV